MLKFRFLVLSALVMVAFGLIIAPNTPSSYAQSDALTYTIVDTGQSFCYAVDGSAIPCPTADAATFGQDGNYQGLQAAYLDNNDGTVTDLNTGLMWTQDYSNNVTWDEAQRLAEALSIGGYDDWRVPTIKELYSLMDFSGASPGNANDFYVPYLDTDVFNFDFGDTSNGERIIDAQYWSSTVYTSTTMNGDATAFGVNFADGRIKGYSTSTPRNGQGSAHDVRFVRGNTAYGINDFMAEGEIIIDKATGLQWMRYDAAYYTEDGLMPWADALQYCENSTIGGFDDWRLPDAKALQSIVDYSRSPDATNSAAIDPLFTVTSITNEAGAVDYPFFWTSTSHLDGPRPGDRAVYISFGRALGNMEVNGASGWMDVHGAGAQRSDPKSGDPANFADGSGPQGDAIRIENAVRCVRGGTVTVQSGGAIDTRWENMPRDAQ